ncbi:MAG: glycosyltransferase [Ignavibacteriaceae bacterium]
MYPIIIFGLSKCCKSEIKENRKFSSVSILVSVYNEQKVIRDRIENLISSDYSGLTYEIIVGSDGSNDKTNEILKQLEIEYSELRVEYFVTQRGKASVINDLVDLAKNEILIFTDANTIFSKNAIQKLLNAFENKYIGGVCGRLILNESQNKLSGSINEKRYWQLETYLKKWEGKCGTVIGANGGIFAVQKRLFEKLPVDKPVTDDFLTTMNILNKDYKFVYASDAIAFEEVAPKIKDEFRRKVRFSSTNFQTLTYLRSVLLGKGLITFAFWSHKIFRWFMPVIFILIFILNVVLLIYGDIFWLFFLFQLSFYAISILGFLLSKISYRISLLSVPYFFLLTNVALLIGFVKFIFNKHSSSWESTPR